MLTNAVSPGANLSYVWGQGKFFCAEIFSAQKNFNFFELLWYNYSRTIANYSQKSELWKDADSSERKLANSVI